MLNINEEVKQRLLSRAMLYVHLTLYKHFGILIGEALVYGCKVVTRKFSGIVHDMALHHLRQLLERCINVYESFQELPYIINNLVNDRQFDPELCRSLVAPFKEDAFKEKVKRIIATQTEISIVLTISRIAPKKGPEIIPDAAREVKDVKFVIMGTLGSKAYYRTLMSKIKAVGVKDRVKVLPNVSEDLKIELMAKAIIYFHPMRSEHFGISTVSVMSVISLFKGTFRFLRSVASGVGVPMISHRAVPNTHLVSLYNTSIFRVGCI